MTRPSKVWVGVLVVAVAFGLYLVDLPRPAPLPAPDDLPAGLRGAALLVTPRQVRPGGVITLHITAPGADGPLTYGASYEIDAQTRTGWRYRFIGAETGGDVVSEPVSPQADVFFDAAARFDSGRFRIRVPAVAPGLYRVRKAFIDTGPSDDFELAATFTVVAS